MKTTSTTKPAGTFKRSAITSQELEEIKAEHIPDERGYACACCEEPWPCDKVCLVVRIEELEKVAEAASAVMLIWHEDRDLGGYGPKPMALREALDAAGAAPCHCEICRRQAAPRGGDD